MSLCDDLGNQGGDDIRALVEICADCSCFASEWRFSLARSVSLHI